LEGKSKQDMDIASYPDPRSLAGGNRLLAGLPKFTFLGYPPFFVADPKIPEHGTGARSFGPCHVHAHHACLARFPFPPIRSQERLARLLGRNRAGRKIITRLL